MEERSLSPSKSPLAPMTGSNDADTLTRVGAHILKAVSTKGTPLYCDFVYYVLLRIVSGHLRRPDEKHA